MSDFKKRVKDIEPSTSTRNVAALAESKNNIYQVLAIIGKRAGFIAKDLKRELHSKLEEFASTNENLEEVHENKEQIEISKFYERMPNPALIATDEFLNDKLFVRERTEEDIRKSQERKNKFRR